MLLSAPPRGSLEVEHQRESHRMSGVHLTIGALLRSRRYSSPRLYEVATIPAHRCGREPRSVRVRRDRGRGCGLSRRVSSASCPRLRLYRCLDKSRHHELKGHGGPTGFLPRCEAVALRNPQTVREEATEQ